MKFLSRGKIALVLVMVILTAVVYQQVTQRSNDRERLRNDVRVALEAVKNLMVIQLTGESDIEQSVEKQIWVHEGLRAGADSGGDSVGAKSAELSRTLFECVQEIHAPMHSYMKARTAVQKEWGDTLDGVRSVDEVRQRIAEFEALRLANDLLDSAYQTLPVRLKARLVEADLSSDEIGLSLFAMEYRIELFGRLRQATREIITGRVKQLEVLQREFGRWSVDSDGNVYFERDAANAEYTRYGKEIQDASEVETNLERKLFTRKAQR